MKKSVEDRQISARGIVVSAMGNTRIALLIGLAITLVSCGGGGTDAADVADATVTSDVETTIDDPPTAVDEPSTLDEASATTVAEQVGADADELASEEPGLTVIEASEPPADVVLTPVRLPAMGGIDFAIPEGAVVHAVGDMVMIRDGWNPAGNRYEPSMVIALVSQTTQPGTVLSIEGMTSTAVGDLGSAEPNGELLRLLGRELQGWDFAAAEGVTIGPHYLFAAYPRPQARPDHWQPLPLATLYLEDTAAGVLAIGYTASDEDELAAARALFETVAGTIELDGLRIEETTTAPAHPRPGGFPEAAEIPDGWPAPIDGAYAPIDAAEYSTGNLGTPLRFAVDDGWSVQLNFPGFVVLTAPESFGPGDNGVVMRTGLTHLVPLSTSSEPIGQPLERRIGEPWPTAALSTLLVDELDPVEVGGRQAAVFDVRVDPAADCSDSQPCHFAWMSSSPYVDQVFAKNSVVRIWEFTDDVQRKIAVIAEGGDPAWLDRADELLATFEFFDG